jgi:cellulose synthase/poly-beta-1,6-N-acetylglucosamine synthase-like glycosyltransferase
MTNHINGNDDLSTRELINNLVRLQANTQEQLNNLVERQADTQEQLDVLSNTANSIFARDAILNDIVLELRESSEQHQRNFEVYRFENQRNLEEQHRTTNAALQSLEAILLQLIRNFPPNHT